MVRDPNDEPQYGERVPYVIVRGQSGSRLVDRAVAPLDLIDDWYSPRFVHSWNFADDEWSQGVNRLMPIIISQEC